MTAVSLRESSDSTSQWLANVQYVRQYEELYHNEFLVHT